MKKRLWHRCFPVNLGKFLRTPFFKEHLRYLLLFFACISLKREGCFCGKIFVHMSRFGSTKYSLRLSIWWGRYKLEKLYYPYWTRRTSLFHEIVILSPISEEHLAYLIQLITASKMIRVSDSFSEVSWRLFIFLIILRSELNTKQLGSKSICGTSVV